MFKNFIFAILFCYFVTNCTPKQYFDSTGKYTKLKGKEYIRDGDSLTVKGYPVYRLTSYKTRTFGGQTIRISSNKR